MSKLKPAAWAHISDGKIGSITYSKCVAGSWDATGAKVTPLYAIPEGYALVPLEPTHKMLTSGVFACADPIACALENVDIAFMRAKYKAMIESAQDEQ